MGSIEAFIAGNKRIVMKFSKMNVFTFIFLNTHTSYGNNMNISKYLHKYMHTILYFRHRDAIMSVMAPGCQYILDRFEYYVPGRTGD